jgi:tetratricopeptide (TPR) repeat protein
VSKPGVAPVASKPAPAAPRPAAPAAAKPPLAPGLEPAALEALVAKLAKVDHFEALGVKRDATAAQIKVAYFQLAKLYHPDAVPTTASQQVKSLASAVFAKLSEAWGVLGEDAKRAKYLEELKSGGAADLDVMNILHSENVFQTGTLLVKARKYEDAKAKFEEALKLNPDEAEFAMWRAWCEFLLAADKKRAHGACAATIEAALRKNAKCPPGYLFLGQMAKLVGDVAAAEKYLKRGLAAVPDHADLVRELKYLRK